MTNKLKIISNRGREQTKDNPLTENSTIEKMRDDIGCVRRLVVDQRLKKIKARNVEIVERARTEEEARIAITAIKLGGASLRAALIAQTTPQLGALTTKANAATAAVDQALTNAHAGEVYTHLYNRAENFQLADDLAAANKITQDEANTIKEFAANNAALDVMRSAKRTEMAKDALDELHSYAMEGITKAREYIGS